jgi:hypothetical protein
MGEAILKLLREPEKIQSWGKTAQDLIKAKFSPQVQLKKTLAVYESIAHRTH